MRIRSIIAFAALATILAGMTGSRGGACRTADFGQRSLASYLDGLIAYVGDIVSESATKPAPHEARLADSLPFMSPPAIQHITQEAVCARAVAAVDLANKALIDGGKRKPAASVIVLRVGNVYVVQDLDQYTGEWLPTYVFDLHLQSVKAIFLY